MNRQFFAEDKDPDIVVSCYSIHPHDSTCRRLTFILAAPTSQPCTEAGQEVNESSSCFMLG